MPTHPNATTPRQFRIDDTTLAELDYLQSRLGLTSRADVIRHLSRRAAIAEGFEPEKKVEKKDRKKGEKG